MISKRPNEKLFTIRKMQIKATITSYLPIRVTIIKKLKDTNSSTEIGIAVTE